LYFFYQIVLFIRFFITFGTLKTILFIIMKKLLLTGAFALASFLNAQAQDVFATEGFEGTLTGWSAYDLDGDGENFGIFNSSTGITGLGFSGKVAGSANFTVSEDQTQIIPADDTDNVLSTPVITLPDGGSYASFRIGAGSVTETPAAVHYAVYAVTEADLADVEDEAGVQAVLDGLTPVAQGNVTDSSSVVNADLSSYEGQEVILFFRHFNVAEQYGYLFVDDIAVSSGVAGIKDVAASTFSVFPNPANDIVTVAGGNALVNNVSIVDINGRTVKSVKLDGVANAQINVSDLAKGIYVMTISSDKGATTQKLMKN
jgi:hypothetical protein